MDIKESCDWMTLICIACGKEAEFVHKGTSVCRCQEDIWTGSHDRMRLSCDECREKEAIVVKDGKSYCRECLKKLQGSDGIMWLKSSKPLRNPIMPK